MVVKKWMGLNIILRRLRMRILVLKRLTTHQTRLHASFHKAETQMETSLKNVKSVYIVEMNIFVINICPKLLNILFKRQTPVLSLVRPGFSRNKNKNNPHQNMLGRELLSKPNSNSNSMQLGLRLDTVLAVNTPQGIFRLARELKGADMTF